MDLILTMNQQIRRESIEKRLSERLAKERSELEDKLKVRTQERLATQRNAEQARLGVRVRAIVYGCLGRC